MGHAYQFKFCESVPIEAVEESMGLAILAIQSLHGESLTRLEARHHLDLEAARCVVDAQTGVGEDLARVFTGFCTHQFGPTGFTVHVADRISLPPHLSNPSSN